MTCLFIMKMNYEKELRRVRETIGGEVMKAVGAAIVKANKQVIEAGHIVGILQVQLDIVGTELKKLEANVVLAKSEVIMIVMKVRAEWLLLSLR